MPVIPAQAGIQRASFDTRVDRRTQSQFLGRVSEFPPARE